ncbi:uridine kinase [Amycolatopsis sp. NPDC059027]|uniref:uridine kinase family protein n=1 Tax=Amycolatopsis sp. NPDC059027 TaxID=3346709 RepID=UPI00366D515A
MLAVDGPSGAGKSTFARSIVADFRARDVPVVLLSTDEFATWNDPVAWWPRLFEGVLRPLSDGSPGAYRRMEWPPEGPRLGASVTVPVPEVLVLEGVSSGRSSVRPLLSHLCWVDGGDEAARLARSVARDGLDHRSDLRRWQLFERGWFAVDGTREAADSHVD